MKKGAVLANWKKRNQKDIVYWSFEAWKNCAITMKKVAWREKN
jgi:hypothetical protein